MVVTTRAALAAIAIEIAGSCGSPTVPDRAATDLHAYVFAAEWSDGLRVEAEASIGSARHEHPQLIVLVNWLGTSDTAGLSTDSIVRYDPTDYQATDVATEGPWTSSHNVELASITPFVVHRDDDRMTLTPEPEFDSYGPITLERAEQGWRQRRKPRAVWLLDIPIEEVP